MPLIEYIRSPYLVSVHINDARLLLDLLVTHDIPFHGQKAADDTFSLLLYASHYGEYTRLRGKRRYRNEARKRLGLLTLAERYKKRKGLAVGFLLAAFLLIFSSLFIWDITVEGADRIPEKTISDALAARGLTLGAFIPSLDTEITEQMLILDVDGLSFVSIKRKGTVIRVEVREREKETEILDTQSPSNLIASADGQIEALLVTGGFTAVKLGQTVKKGDLLVSGIIDSNALGYRLVRARGEVLARTTLSYQAEIPYETTEKVYTGRFFSQKSLKIFSKTIKLFRKDNISSSSCDKIESERRIYLFGLIKLPIFITETEYAEYELVSRTLTQKEALQEASHRIRALYENDISEADILARYSSFTENENGITVKQQIECVINIAKEVKIE